MGKLVILLLLLASFLSWSEASSNDRSGTAAVAIDDEEREFIPLPPLNTRNGSTDAEPNGSAVDDSSAASTTGEPSSKTFIDSFMLDETVSVSLNCEKTLGSSERALKSFVMKSLDFEEEETFLDLERSTCRALFDRNGGELTREQIRILMSTERGMRILQEGEVLEFFRDFSSFSFEDFAKFPSLQIGRIRELSSVRADVLLALIHLKGFSTVGKLELIPEKFGDRIFDDEDWQKDPAIWQLFTLEGLAQLKSVEETLKFAKFLANHKKFEKMLSTPESCCKYANLVARWAVQSEELLVYIMEMMIHSTLASSKLVPVVTAVELIIEARALVLRKLKEKTVGLPSFTERDSLHLDNVKALLENPLTWRLRESLKLKLLPNPNPATPLTPMTAKLLGVLDHFPFVIEFYRGVLVHPGAEVSNDELLSHFFNVNEITTLEAIFEEPLTATGTSAETRLESNVQSMNEKLVLSISIRRFLLLLLSPQMNSSNLIQGALNYVFTAQSPLLASSTSLEVLRWFSQARDLQAISVLDQLIRNFGHEFNVSQEVVSMLGDTRLRMKLFTEAQSVYVRLLAVLDHNLKRLRVQDSLKRIFIHYVDPAEALLKLQVPPLQVNPRRAPTQQELDAQNLKIEKVQAHNEVISKSLTGSLAVLETLHISPDTGVPNAQMSGFMQLHFEVNFIDSPGVDAGGLRRTWVSALLRIFGDEQRKLFPQHEAGGRVPSALLDPEIMAHLGALHGKSLQINVKPDWFFTSQFSQQVLFVPARPLEDLAGLVEELYPEIFENFDLILRLEVDTEAVDYFNGSEFPSIEGLTRIIEEEEQVNEDDNEETSEEIIEDGAIYEETDENVRESSSENGNNGGEVSQTIPSTISRDSSDSSMQIDPENQLGIDAQTPLLLDSIIPPLELPLNDVDSFPPQAPRNSMQSFLIPEDLVSQNGFDSDDSETPTSQATTQAHTSTRTPGPLRHSFSRMLVFDVRYLAQESIYKGPRVTVTDRAGIVAYRAELVQLFAQNLMAGREAYWRNFLPFFDPAYQSLLDPVFLHNLLDPPIIEISEIMTRIQFNRACDTILLLDDDDEETEETEDNPVKKPRAAQRSVKNISARQAFNRIVGDSFNTPETVKSFLSFTTGCPQVPPAGLDALRISVNCFVSDSPANRLSKSHTCANQIDFYASLSFKDSKEALKESVISSSGFGFA